MTWKPIAEAPIKPFGTVPSYYSYRAMIAYPWGEKGEAMAVHEGVFSWTSTGKPSWKTMYGSAKPTHYAPLPDPPR